jgi:hypothetical protein
MASTSAVSFFSLLLARKPVNIKGMAVFPDAADSRYQLIFEALSRLSGMS